ncbi:MAG: isoquinoline 1-oxidoreductase alpha subunit [Phenylobacterium sp.]|jgi:isoquinoline 1-oxidoreductase alpha subunit
MVTFKINGKSTSVNADLDMPLLWFLRENSGLKGTKFGCGIGMCGACSVHIDGNVVRSCSVTLAALDKTDITTIEGLSEHGDHPVQQAWKTIDVPQCGYCQSGQIMAATALLADNPNPDDDAIDAAMTNICRCGTYVRIRQAIHLAASMEGKIKAL